MQPDYDEKIMNELLSQPSVRRQVLQMTAKEFEMYRQLLISQGIYARFAQERKGK